MTRMQTPRTHRFIRNHAQGYTLLELLVVVALLAIIAALATPAFTAGNTAKARAAARALIADFAYAQSLSMGSETPVLINFSSDGAGYWAAFATDPAVPLRDPKTGKAFKRDFSQDIPHDLFGVRIASCTQGGVPTALIQFGALGELAVAQDVVVTMTCAGEDIRISFDSAMGSPTVLSD